MQNLSSHFMLFGMGGKVSLELFGAAVKLWVYLFP